MLKHAAPVSLNTPWYALKTEQAMESLATGVQGISVQEAEARLALYGTNTFPPHGLLPL